MFSWLMGCDPPSAESSAAWSRCVSAAEAECDSHGGDERGSSRGEEQFQQRVAGRRNRSLPAFSPPPAHLARTIRRRTRVIGRRAVEERAAAPRRAVDGTHNVVPPPSDDPRNTPGDPVQASCLRSLRVAQGWYLRDAGASPWERRQSTRGCRRRQSPTTSSCPAMTRR